MRRFPLLTGLALLLLLLARFGGGGGGGGGGGAAAAAAAYAAAKIEAILNSYVVKPFTALLLMLLC
jgi:hypothetical protein